MKIINLCFRVHQRNILKRYRFFNIGVDHYYYDDYANESAIEQSVAETYSRANQLLLDMIEESGKKFRVSFSITGVALDLFQQYAPEVIESFQRLASTGCVEFLATTYGHSLASLFSETAFEHQVRLHAERIKELFGQTPVTFANTALLYNDNIAAQVERMGLKSILMEDAKHVMGWRSAHYLYQPASLPKVKLLVRDSKLSDDINYRFSHYDWEEYPLTADKFIDWIARSPIEEEVFNICMGYEALGRNNRAESGIFDFFRALPSCAQRRGVGFATPSAIVKTFKPVASLEVTYPVSWADEEKDASAWHANVLQHEALTKLYDAGERIPLLSHFHSSVEGDFVRLQDATNFFFMTTKHYTDGMIEEKQIPYDSPYDAFMNYMNILSDFRDRVDALCQQSEDCEGERLTFADSEDKPPKKKRGRK